MYSQLRFKAGLQYVTEHCDNKLKLYDNDTMYFPLFLKILQINSKNNIMGPEPEQLKWDNTHQTNMSW